MSEQPTIFPALKKPYILAHQGGAALAPTNTMAAFASADTIEGIDFLDIDVHMTKDGHLVGIHDATVNRTTNGRGRVDGYTLADLQRLDAGYRFRDLQGEYKYRGKGVYIPSLEEVFHAYAEKYYLHFEIKDTYPKGEQSQVEEKLWALIQRYHVEKRVIVSSFKQSIVRRFHQLSQGQTVIAASQAEVARFVLAYSVRQLHLYRPLAQALEIPVRSNGINLKSRSLINAAHRLGMEVYYWTIDDAPTMRELIGMGADGLFTDRPNVLRDVLLEMGLR